MIRKETRIINGREAHLYYDEERQVYLVAIDLMEEFLGLYESADKLANQLAEESNLTPCYLGCPCEYQNEDAKMPMEYWNKGWIPIENGLPQDDTRVYTTIKTERGGIGMQDCWYAKGVFKIYGSLEPLEDYKVEVIAWKTIAPYTPKE